jgi:serine/threonine-protein kinase
MTDAAVAIGRVVAGRYLIGRLLGSGTMGTVHAAFDLAFDEEVAIKFASSEGLSREELVERFRREADVAARIKSDHVVRVLDTGQVSDDAPFMVMELLNGHGLDVERELRGVIPIDEAVGYVLPAIEVLAEAHAAGAVHRDIKPANLFLEKKIDGRPWVKVLDFGVSKAALELGGSNTRITKSGMIMGSPLYMAPEQLRSAHTVDARADIWSLGAILYELVTGCTAHEGDSVAELCATLLRDPPRPITDFASELPPRFAEVVMRCLEPDPERRYTNVVELGVALLPFAKKGALHVERARNALAQRASRTETSERSPSSDSPMTLHVEQTAETSADHELEQRATPSFQKDDASPVGGFRMARMVMAFTLVGLGIGTAFLIEFPEHARKAPVAGSPAVTAAPPSSAAALAPSANEALPPAPPLVASSPAASASAPEPSPPSASAEQKRSTPAKPVWKAKPKRQPAAAPARKKGGG